jgi:hypothetical protein
MLKYQQQRHCFIKIDREPTQPLMVTDVSSPYVEPETLIEYQGMLYAKQGSLSGDEVDQLLIQSHDEFMARAGFPRQADATAGASSPTPPEDDDYGLQPKLPRRPGNKAKT